MTWYDSSDGDWTHFAEEDSENLERYLRNMTKKRDTEYLHGKIYWAKIFGAPRTNYNEDGREWAFEFEPDDAALEVIVKTHKLKDRLKDKYKKNGDLRNGYENRDRDYIILKRKEFDFEGNPNDHIRVVDAANQKWNPKVEIGNETEVDLKVQIVDYGAGKKKGIYPVAIRVLDLVAFERSDFAPLPSDDKRAQKAKEQYGSSVEEDFGGDDEGDTQDEAPEEVQTTEEDEDDTPA